MMPLINIRLPAPPRRISAMRFPVLFWGHSRSKNSRLVESAWRLCWHPCLPRISRHAIFFSAKPWAVCITVGFHRSHRSHYRLAGHRPHPGPNGSAPAASTENAGSSGAGFYQPYAQWLSTKGSVYRPHSGRIRYNPIRFGLAALQKFAARGCKLFL